ncbi:hydrogen peroxide-inducible genes activator [Suttonella ornithocola]|uniref:Morphology and auto-aggregation control protein n=1 Tax=Suttonella ornithocola TaxID=279832 RepID=A0A380MQ18_9GAMM|nr:hydrogen peroxide-inducible genes activator [Suttonella ornithocola]SUO93993.1 Morphology and auto-aggregation control protein [Suttonella ornithocola]
MITLRQIQFALAVARHRHFKRAAEECNISQSALSLGIAELEKNLGVAIFERNNKQVVITPIGAELLERAQKVYLDAQQLVERAHAGQNDLGFAMSIGFIPTIAPFLLPLALPIIREKYPDFEMNVSEDTSERLLNAVQTGRIDAAVLALPFETPGLNVFEFGQENFYVLVHKDDKLANKKLITSNDLKNAHLLLLGEGHCLRDHVMEVCKLQYEMGKDMFKDASLNTLIQLTANNMGVTLIPEMALPQMKHLPNLKAIPLDAKGPHRRLAVATRPNYPREKDLKTLIQLFSQSLAPIAK